MALEHFTDYFGPMIDDQCIAENRKAVNGPGIEIREAIETPARSLATTVEDRESHWSSSDHLTEEQQSASLRRYTL